MDEPLRGRSTYAQVQEAVAAQFARARRGEFVVVNVWRRRSTLSGTDVERLYKTLSNEFGLEPGMWTSCTPVSAARGGWRRWKEKR